MKGFHSQNLWVQLHQLHPVYRWPWKKTCGIHCLQFHSDFICNTLHCEISNLKCKILQIFLKQKVKSSFTGSWIILKRMKSLIVIIYIALTIWLQEIHVTGGHNGPTVMNHMVKREIGKKILNVRIFKHQTLPSYSIAPP